MTEERNDNEELEALILGLAPAREAELREIARDGGTPDWTMLPTQMNPHY